MPNDVINTITIGNITYDIGGSGHTIEKSDGTDMTQRANLQFIDANISDDSTNNRTKIENVKVISSESELTNLPDGIYMGSDDEGIPFDAGDIDYDNTKSGLTADTVQEAIDELSLATNKYSNTERVIGVWTDGSLIYQKVINITSYNIGGNTNIPHGITNFGQLIRVWGKAVRNDGYWNPIPLPVVTGWNMLVENFNSTSFNFFVGDQLGGTYALTEIQIVIEYTKSS